MKMSKNDERMLSEIMKCFFRVAEIENLNSDIVDKAISDVKHIFGRDLTKNKVCLICGATDKKIGVSNCE